MNVLEKLLEEFDNMEMIHVNYRRDTFRDGFSSGSKKCCEIIRSHMDEVENAEIEPVSKEFLKDCAETAKRYKRNIDGWIPVEDGLPERTDYYLVQLSRKLPNEDYSDRVVVLYNGEEKEFMCYEKLIIAWQPLPERYKPAESKSVKNTQQEMEDFWRNK